MENGFMEQTVKCFDCNKIYTVKDIRYGPDGKTLLCKDCLQKRQAKAAKTAAPAPAKGKTLVGYVCSRCHYRFTRGPEIEVRTCPYCSRDSVQRQKNTASMLNDPTDDDDIY